LNKLAEPLSSVSKVRGSLNLSPIVAKLNKTRTVFLRTADGISCEQWNAKPSTEEWSAAELVAHLVLVESGIVATAGRVIEKSPKPFSAWERLHLPMFLAEVRILRLKSPAAMVPTSTSIGAKECMLKELQQTREASLRLLEETKSRKLEVYCWKHPFLGRLNFYEWFEMIAAHEVRHTRQLREISGGLRKVV
jgi:hypothetical protein